MSRLTSAALGRPKLVVALWVVGVVVLGLVGLQAQDRVTQTSLVLPGAPSADAEQMAIREFGEGSIMPILLRGPQPQLDRQGKAVVSALRSRPGSQVLSPWDRGADRELLRPKPGTALIVLRQAKLPGQAVDEVAPPVQRLVDRHTSRPVRAHVSGVAPTLTALKQRAFDAVARAEKLAVVALLVVLLLVFRAPLAAAVPALAGLVSVLSGYGIIALIASQTALDTVALSLASMMGLALGVDYSLLLVSRFREELAQASPVDAARTAVATAGRAVVFAGGVLLTAMVVAAMVAPGNLLLSAAVGVVVVTSVGVLAALTLVPVVLAAMGSRIDWMRLGGARVRAPLLGRAARRLLRRPLPIAAAVGAALIVLAAPAFGLKTGPPDVRQLPADSAARQDYEAVRDALGPGWTAPFEIVAVAPRGTIADPPRLRAFDRFQERLARDPSVALVVGPGDIAPAQRRLRRATKELSGAGRDLRRGRHAVGRLDDGLGRARAGVTQLRGGLRDAASGAERLAAGGEQAAAGSRQLSDGLGRATDGARKAEAALRRAAAGGRRLAAGSDKLRHGAERLQTGVAKARRGVEGSLPQLRELASGLQRGSEDLGRLREPATTADDELRKAYEALMTMSVGRADPQYRRAFEAVGRARAAVSGRNPLTGARVDPQYEGLPASLERAASQLRAAGEGAGRGVQDTERLATGLRRLETGAAQLSSGAGRLARGLDSLHAGLRRLRQGGGELEAGLARLQAGAGRLSEGLGRLHGGAGRLADGLASGSKDSGRLETGLGRLKQGTARFEKRLDDTPSRRIRLLSRSSPGLEKSGYLTLAGLDGARRAARTEAAFAVNIDRGGRAGRVLVIPRTGPNRPQTEALGARLQRRADELAAASGTQAGVTGPAAQLADYGARTSEGLVALIVALALLSWIVLIPVCRSLLLPLIAVLLNLLTVGVAFGALALLFQGDAPLGGPGYIDAVSISVIYTVIFGLSIDYEVFLITRMREAYDETGDPVAAIEHGLDRTAAVVTGAAAIMVGVFVAFAAADVINVRQFGVGLTVAVILDATIVRLVLLPAAMRLGGRATWWLPSALESRLPRVAA